MEPSAALEARLRELVQSSLGARVRALAWLEGQLGLRRFARLTLEGPGPAHLIARIDAAEDPAGRPPGIPAEPPLEPIRARLERAGLPVPARYAADEDAGIELLEDLGDLCLRDAAATAEPPRLRALYHEACDLVPRLQAVGDGDLPAFRRRLDAAHFAYKAELFGRYSLASRGNAGTPAELAVVRQAFEHVARVVCEAPERLAHRDFQSANLLLRPAGGLAMIDLQGALLSAPEYDLACLLRDSYVELEESELMHQLERIRPALPDAPEAETFLRRFDLLTLTRKGKDHARFLFAAQERGDPRFLAFVPATVRALRRAAARAAAREPALGALAELVHQLPEQPCGA